MDEYRVSYLHEDTPAGGGFFQSVTASSPEDAVLSILKDESITCACCSPIRVIGVDQKAYGRYKECPSPVGGWNATVTK